MAQKTANIKTINGGAKQRFIDASDAPDLTVKNNARKVESDAKDAPDVTTRTPVYRKPVFIIGTLAVLLVAAVLGLRYYYYSTTHEYTDDAFIEADAVQVNPRAAGTVRKVYVSDNQQVKAGDLLVELDARDYEARLNQARAALQAGLARREQARANLALTRTTANAGVAQASSNVETTSRTATAARRAAAARRSTIAEAAANVRTAEANFEQTAADVTAARAAVERDSKDVARYQELFDKDAVSRQRLDQAITQARTSNAQLDSAQKRRQAAAAAIAQASAGQNTAVRDFEQSSAQADAADAQIEESRARLADANAAPARIRVIETETSAADAEIAQAQAQIDEAELQLSYTKIFAPENGRVTRKAVDEGQFVQNGQQLMQIVYGSMWVTANFKETQLTEMRVGQPVEIEIDAFSDKKFRGRVESFQSGTGSRFSLLPAENATGNYVKVVQRVPVKIVFDEQPDLPILAPGLSVVPTVDIREKPNT